MSVLHEGTRVRVKDVKPHPKNPRPRHLEVADLVESIRVHGLLQPVVVTEDNLLVAGHRRLEAAKKLGWEEVPCVTVDGEQADAILVAANAHIEPVDLMMEAALVTRMLDEVLNVQAVAHELGKDVRWVAQRRALAELSDRWKKVLTTPQHPMHDLGLASLLEVAKLAPNVQDILLDEWDDYDARPTVAQVSLDVQRLLTTLASAPWNLDADKFGEVEVPPCATCVKHSLANPGLFDDGAEQDIKKAVCRDLACFEHKLNATVRAELLVLRDRHPGLHVLRDRSFSGRVELLDETVEGFPKCDHRFDRSKKSAPGAVPVVKVNTSGCGKVYYASNVHAAPGGTAVEVTRAGGRRAVDPETGEKVATPLKVRKERLETRRIVHALKAAARHIEDGLVAPSFADALELAVAVGIEADWSLSSFRAHASVLDEKASAVTLWEACRRRIAKQVEPHPGISHDGASKNLDVVREVFAASGEDVAPLLAAAEAAIPTPKAWENLAADGNPKPKKAVRKTAARRKARAK